MIRVSDAQWIGLSDHAEPISPAGIADVVQSGSIVVEFTRPQGPGLVLLDYRSDVGWPRAISIFYDEEAGIAVLHRQGEAMQRHHLPGPLAQDGGFARLTFTWDGPARVWSLLLEDAAGTRLQGAEGINPMPLQGSDILALCGAPDAARRDACVAWFGVCTAPVDTPTKAWLGLRTPIDTQRGRIAAGELQIGDRIATVENGFQPLRGLHRMMLPNRGRFAPVLLRAPYFAQRTDLLVAPGQLTLLSGAAVEYLFGEDAVLAPAAALRDGNTALPDARRPMSAGIALDLGDHQLIEADGCTLLCSADATGDTLPYRLLHDYEVLPLQSLLGRGGQRSAA